MQKVREEKTIVVRAVHILTLCLTAVVLNLFAHENVTAQQKIQKDERLGVILSFGAPGFGQIYAGKTWRGIGIMVVEGICAGVVTGIVDESRKIKVTGVDGHDYEVVSTKTKKLSNGEIAAVATAAVAGLGIYVWQLFDARNCVRNHNKAQGFDIGMTMMNNGRPGANLRVTF
jgi:TM2 domain-containing membrane protein YozV